MKIVNTPDATVRDQDWGAGVQLYLNTNQQHWYNNTGKDVRVRLTLEISAAPAYKLQDAGQTIRFTPNVGTTSSHSSVNDLKFLAETWTQEDSWRGGVIHLKNEIVVPSGLYLFYTVESSDALDDEVRSLADETKIWDVDDVDVGRWLATLVTLGGSGGDKPDVNVDQIADAAVPTLPTNFADFDITATTGRVNVGKITDSTSAADNLKAEMDKH